MQTVFPMKGYIRKALVTLALMILSNSAFADVYLGIEVPLSYGFKQADDGSSLDADGMPSGYILLAQLPFFSGGIGFESYDIKLDMTGDHHINIWMADAFYILPIPVVDVALGAGYGTVELKGDNASYYEKSTSSQFFVRLAVPISPMVKIIGSYHNVFARVKAAESDSLMEAGGTLTTFGLAVGF